MRSHIGGTTSNATLACAKRATTMLIHVLFQYVYLHAYSCASPACLHLFVHICDMPWPRRRQRNRSLRLRSVGIHRPWHKATMWPNQIRVHKTDMSRAHDVCIMCVCALAFSWFSGPSAFYACKLIHDICIFDHFHVQLCVYDREC